MRDRVNKEFKKQKFSALLQILFFVNETLNIYQTTQVTVKVVKLNFLFRKYKKVLEIILMLAMPPSAPWVAELWGSVEEWGHTAIIYVPT